MIIPTEGSRRLHTVLYRVPCGLEPGYLKDCQLPYESVQVERSSSEWPFHSSIPLCFRTWRFRITTDLQSVEFSSPGENIYSGEWTLWHYTTLRSLRSLNPSIPKSPEISHLRVGNPTLLLELRQLAMREKAFPCLWNSPHLALHLAPNFQMFQCQNFLIHSCFWDKQFHLLRSL